MERPYEAMQCFEPTPNYYKTGWLEICLIMCALYLKLSRQRGKKLTDQTQLLITVTFATVKGRTCNVPRLGTGSEVMTRLQDEPQTIRNHAEALKNAYTATRGK